LNHEGIHVNLWFIYSDQLKNIYDIKNTRKRRDESGKRKKKCEQNNIKNKNLKNKKQQCDKKEIEKDCGDLREKNKLLEDHLQGKTHDKTTTLTKVNFLTSS